MVCLLFWWNTARTPCVSSKLENHKRINPHKWPGMAFTEMWITKVSNTHTHRYTHSSVTPHPGCLQKSGPWGISSNGRKLVSVICCHGGLNWHWLTLDWSRRDTDREPRRGKRGRRREKAPGQMAWEDMHIIHLLGSMLNQIRFKSRERRNQEILTESILS